MDFTPEYYTITEFSKLFAISPYTVKRWIRRKELTAVKIGKLWRIPRQEADRLKKGE